MGTKAKPGPIDCYAKAEPDEPLFVLLGRDRHAPDVIRAWAALRAGQGEDPEVVQEALTIADECAAWRARRRAAPAGGEAPRRSSSSSAMRAAVRVNANETGAGRYL